MKMDPHELHRLHDLQSPYFAILDVEVICFQHRRGSVGKKVLKSINSASRAISSPAVLFGWLVSSFTSEGLSEMVYQTDNLHRHTAAFLDTFTLSQSSN